MKEFIKINLASPQKILSWTERSLPNGELVGEITKPETIHHDNFKPVIGGLFCEKIFGPTKDWECYCKKYKNIQRKINKKKKINLCPKCNVEITETKIRNYRMGYIKLSTPITHLWYLKNTPSYIANEEILKKLKILIASTINTKTIINKTIKETNNIVYNKSYIKVKERKKKDKYVTGGEAINLLLKKKRYTKETNDTKIEKKLYNYENRLKLMNYFVQTKTKPSWMTIKYLPVLPPNLRPIVRLQDKTIIVTDVNFLYGNIINSNNKIIKLRKMYVPERFLNNEKLILQDKVDKLINNEKASINNIQGKKGRFRENLLGKTVDYSGRSVIVVEPNLKLNECGIPREMGVNYYNIRLFELYQPLIIKNMIKLKLINTIREGKFIYILSLDNKCKNLILLNRAPTLHRVGIQAFQPKITTEKAIQLHPLVCSAFNADFDGDQMGVHIPLSLKAQAEARTLIMSTNNCTSAATGQPNISPSQDMILGCYYITIENGSLFYLLKKILCL
uniref:RNA polymerase subunit beta' n=1 Tax=Euglena undulata TaxID=1685799 RepID=UPI0023AAF613|nr:RNA polymerase subunit beta' [Euglena undulata]WCH63457.1 RNA polymerase subunit beta' [Euglena undulata]